VLPDGGLPCVWMTAGLLAWRLCDREYDCEHCPLDAALGGEHAPVTAGAPAGERRPRLEFPSDRRYSPAHGWVQPREEACVRVGLDALVGRLLDQVSSVVLPAEGSHTQRGQPLCWLVDDGVPIPLASPVAGTVRRTNPRVQADPTLLTRAPYEEGWLLELEAEGTLERRKDLADAAGQRRVTARQLRDLHDRGARLTRRARRAVGATLCDGGLPVRGLRRLLGTPAYHQLVRRLLG
jgi:glycine cleavage system H protein